ncbi:hypothetical protein [Oleiharenicola lentus]|uniref:hypothetical protein n=1 Tax=Oleiharenicola lentus TaxID=2508720 RepID=UPI003F6782E8
MKNTIRSADLAGFADHLIEVAWENLRKVAHTKKPEKKRKPSLTLQPGPDTPVWNELVKSAAPYLAKRGQKVKLARLLGLPRQRIHQLLVEGSACADAERTLLLLAWVYAQQTGQEWS